MPFTYRILWDVPLLGAVFVLPWWAWVIVALYVFYAIPYWYEGIVLGALVMVMSFGTDSNSSVIMWGIGAVGILVLSEIVRSKLR
jgi:hypothetical protein